MRGPFAPTFLAHSPFPVKALLGEEPFASVTLSFAMVTAVISCDHISWIKCQLQSCLDPELGWGVRRSASEKPSGPAVASFATGG